jgi:hypothetical protein
MTWDTGENIIKIYKHVYPENEEADGHVVVNFDCDEVWYQTANGSRNNTVTVVNLLLKFAVKQLEKE